MRWLFALALVAAPASAQDYSPIIIPGQIIGGPETMTPLNGGDDSTRLVQLGFPFQYFGQTFNQAWVSSNGFISFADIGNRCCNGEPIEQAPRNAIYGLWTDLVSGGNPYFRTDVNAAIFGWYNTYEYGSGLTNTFEIAIYPDGKIQWNYADVNNQWHVVTAGLTGPTSTDSFSILYGQNVNLLDNTSYIALGLPEEPEPIFNPVVIGPSVSAAPVVVAVQEAVQEATPAAEEVAAAEPVAEPVAEAVTVVAQAETRTEAVAEARAEVVAEAKQETKQQAERLSPTQLAALTSGRLLSALLPSQVGAQDGQANQEMASQDAAKDVQQEAKQENTAQNASEADQQGSTAQEERTSMVMAQEASNSPERAFNQAELVFSPITPQQGQQLLASASVASVSDVMNPATQLQILDMMSAKKEDSSPAEPDAEMQQLAGNVNLVQYAQAKIPDVAFYNPREIYRKNRPVDAYLVMYRLMMNNDRRWLEMIGQQYE
jgi:hypothetical protein